MTPPRIGLVRRIPLPGVVGITLPPWGILIERRYDCKGLRAHELVHWRQYQRMGRPRALQYIRYGRRAAPMEREARAESGYPRGGC